MLYDNFNGLTTGTLSLKRWITTACYEWSEVRGYRKAAKPVAFYVAVCVSVSGTNVVKAARLDCNPFALVGQTW